jgi:glycine dehydrogenase subunit 2
MAGLIALEVPSDRRGNIDLDALRAACDETVVALMLTNPNTLGLFEEKIHDVVRLVHDCGGLVYGDGANMNALAGIARPGELGIDLMHYNLHKTFATPHGGGGPGSGPLGASERLKDYLPGPIVTVDPSEGPENARYRLTMPERSIGRMSSFLGNFGMFVRAFAYIRVHGSDGLRQNSMHAVLNANYLRCKLRGSYPVPFDRINMHEFVCEGRPKGSHVRALDVSKRLMVIEPTETESRETLDAFVAAMEEIAEEALTRPETLRSAPSKTPVARLDEVRAARELIVCDRAASGGS